MRLAISTEKEKPLIKGVEVVVLEDIDNDPDLAKQTVLGRLQIGKGEPLIVGVDPGRRIGIVGYYGNSEVLGEVVTSADEAIGTIMKLLKVAQKRIKIVRIGNGNPKLAEQIAETLTMRSKGVQIEIVDERGTSAKVARPNIRGARDVSSARMIAFRHGWHYGTPNS